MKRSTLALVALALLLVPATAEAKKKKKAEDVPVVVAEPAPDPEAWRASIPTAGPDTGWQAPVAKTFTLKNGITVYLVERPTLPLVSVRVFVRAGRAANPKGKAGLASLTADLMDEGTNTRSALRLSEDAADLGAILGTSSTSEGAVISLDALGGAALGPSLDLLADITLKPKFDSKEFARIQKETLASISSSASDPRDRAGRAFAAEIFGADHPYGTAIVGTEASVKSLKVSDVTSFYKSYYHAGNATIVVTGSITEADAKAMLDARFGSWKAGSTKAPAVAAPSKPLKTRVVYLTADDAVQSVLRVGTTGVARSGADYWPATMAGTLVAGMFGSRVNMNLREEKGWSYGAGGGFSDSPDHGTFAIRTSVQADKTAPAITEILKELNAAASAPPAETMVAKALASHVESLPGNFESNEAVAYGFLQAPMYGLGPDLWQRFAADANAVLPDGIYAASKTYFTTDRQVIVVVGPKVISVDDGKGGKTEVKVLDEVKALGFEVVER